MNYTAFLLVLVAGVLACGCEKKSTYCTTHLNDPECPDAGVDAKPACTSDDQCSAPTAACDTSTMTCVECTTSNASACTGTKPVCGSDDTCRGCEAHSECSSAACLPDGSCSDGMNVAYVDPAGIDNNLCTKAMPCTTVAKALATGRPYVKLTGTIDEAVTINDQTVTFLAGPGAKLTRSGIGNILRIDGASKVKIYDLEISGALGTGGAVSISSGGTQDVALVRARIGPSTGTGPGVAALGGTLSITRGTISGNGGGGISINDAQFTLTNNMITNNGGNASQLGGVKIDGITTAGMHVLDFNTITQNQGPMTVNTGITCGTVLTPLAFSSNIIYANIVAGGGQQLGGSANCTATYSDIGPDGTATGTNINMDPMFVMPSTRDYHLKAGSPCKDVADPAATLNVDIDGDTRPQGSGRDIGADEVQ